MKTVKRRRAEGKTNYSRRIKLLKGNKLRVVFRKTNRYLIAQLVESIESKDRIISGVNSKDLLKIGWPGAAKGSLKTLPAAYLTGLLFGKKVPANEEVILDIGVITHVHGNKIYAFLKGLIDAGVNIKYDEKTFPKEERISGSHLKNKIPFNEIKLKIIKEEK